jgi:3',5'-cyclic AMP phosphodiesterase CpdA
MPALMRVAHFSDLHVLALEGVDATRFLNKRFTGWVNLRLKRGHIHRPSYVRAIAREITTAKVDHVVITGDLTNLALEQEFDAVRSLLEDELGLDAAHVTIVPGNHDLYTRGAMRDRRFTTFFDRWMQSDLPELAADLPLGRFPVVKLRGPLAFIGLSSAVPRLPLVAAGELGRAQIEAFDRILAHDEVKRRTPIVALHHPVHNPASRIKTLVEGLRDADDLVEVVRHLPQGLFLHGHLHKRIQRTVATLSGKVLSVGATSASLEHENEHKMAGFNLYEFDGAGGLLDVEAHVFDPGKESFRIESVPKQV